LGHNTLIWSGAWCLREQDGVPVLLRAIDGSMVALDGAPGPAVHSMFERLSASTEEDEAVALLEGLGGSGVEALSLLEDLAVVRRMKDDAYTAVAGEGALAEAVLSVASTAGWGVTAIHAFEPCEWRNACGFDDKMAIAVACFGKALLGIPLNSGCPSCAVLRTLGRIGTAREEQSHILRGDARASAERVRAVVVELFISLSREPLKSGEGIMVVDGEGAQRGTLLAHPDCPSCGGTFDSKAASALEPLMTSKSMRRSTATIREALVDSPFAPATLERREGKPGELPMGLPFIFGGTRLSRMVADRVWCTSLPGVVHGSAETEELAERLALSEAVERLAAQSVSPGVWLPSTDAGAGETQRRYGWWPAGHQPTRGAYVHGVDLVFRSSCLVPFGRVAVACPTTLDPEGAALAFTGTASHDTIGEAILNATVEVLKRDAFVVSWYRRRRLPRLTWPQTPDESIQRRLRYLDERGIDLELFDLTLDVPLPLVLVRARARLDTGNWPAGGVIMTPAGGFSPIEALSHALKLVCGRVVSLTLEPSDDRDPRDAEAVARIGRDVPFWPLLARYLDPRNAEATVIGPSATRDFDTLPRGPAESVAERLECLRAWFRARALDWLVVPLTDSVAQYAGFEVAKVVMPQLVRLTMERDPVELARPRLHLPLDDSPSTELNPHPHPLY
jgi:ribosomal protein S12 methylthiotransferase accessory factor